MIAFNLDALQGYLAACKEWKNPALLVVGHTAPDGDAVVSSLLEAFRRHLTDGVQAVPVVQAASLPRECAWLLGDIAPLVPTRERLARHPDTPLVLHGGSGLSDDDFRTAIRRGIAKMNIFTDINVAGARAIREAVQAEKCAMTDLMNLQVEAVKAETIKKMRLFGSEGKA